MWKSPRYWVPVAAAAALATGLMWGVERFFDGNVGSYVLAASSIVLVGVTFSYMVATFDVVNAANAQVAIARRERSIDATVAIWHGYSDLGNRIDSCRWYIERVLSSPELDLNRWATVESGDSQHRIALLRRFLADFDRREILLPSAVRASGKALCDEIGDLVQVEDALSQAIRAEIGRSVTAEEPFDRQRLDDDFWWRVGFLHVDRTWDDLARGSRKEELAHLLANFKGDVTAVLGDFS